MLRLLLCIVLLALPAAAELPAIRVDEAGTGFEVDGKPFHVWGVNYDHAGDGQLLENYWLNHWNEVVSDFGEMRELGVNVVRIHLQVGAFLRGSGEPNAANLAKLGKLLELAEKNGLYLDITGLGCYHKHDIPAWYDALTEAERWNAQARFWKAVAAVGAKHSAVFCYDLMNEPALPAKEKVDGWLVGEPLGGKYFVQRIALELNGRDRKALAKSWIEKLTTAIREEDKNRLITVGVIPWAHVWPNAKPLFHDPVVGKSLDFVSVHFYPKSGQVDKALNALKVYDIGKPLVIEEMFPLACSIEDMETFLDGSIPFTDGWVSFYWGKTAADYREDLESKPGDIRAAIIAKWLDAFKARSGKMKQ